MRESVCMVKVCLWLCEWCMCECLHGCILRVYVYQRMYTCLYKNAYIYVFCDWVYKFVSICLFVYTCVCVWYVGLCKFVYVSVPVFVNLCMRVCVMCLCSYVY